MAYSDSLKSALVSRLGKDKVEFRSKWAKQMAWKWNGGKPVGIMLHHSAGVGAGVIDYIDNGAGVPAANFSIARDGKVVCHTAYPCYHAGVGSFTGKKPWSVWNIPPDGANRFMLGVEVIDKGQAKTFTEAQKKSLALLIAACSDTVADWEPVWLKNRPQHKDWTGRKVDLKYTNTEVKSWIEKWVK